MTTRAIEKSRMYDFYCQTCNKITPCEEIGGVRYYKGRMLVYYSAKNIKR